MKVHLINSNGLYTVKSVSASGRYITIQKGYNSNNMPNIVIIPFEDIKAVRDVYTKEEKDIKALIFPKVLHYKAIPIRKKNGKVRIVYSITDTELLKAQKKRAKELKLKLSTKACIVKHLNNKFIMKLDIADAFASVHRKAFDVMDEVYAASFGEDGYLLQGTPLASYLFELYMKDLDSYMSTMPCVYTRYVDDITLSGNNIKVLKSVKNKLSVALITRTLKLNDSKSKVLIPGDRGYAVHGVNISQGKLGVRKLKERAFLLIKHGELSKGLGLLNYLYQFVDNDTKERWRLKADRLT